MTNKNLPPEKTLNTLFLKEILDFSNDEAEETAFILISFMSIHALKRLNHFIEFVSEDENFITQFKEYAKSKLNK